MDDTTWEEVKHQHVCSSGKEWLNMNRQNTPQPPALIRCPQCQEVFDPLQEKDMFLNCGASLDCCSTCLTHNKKES